MIPTEGKATVRKWADHDWEFICLIPDCNPRPVWVPHLPYWHTAIHFALKHIRERHQ